jgi:hypothetical protein
MLSQHAVRYNCSRLPFFPSFKLFTQVRFACVLVCDLDHDTPAMSICSFGNYALLLRPSTAFLRRNNAKISHQFLGGGKPREVDHLGQEHHCRQFSDATQTTQSFDMCSILRRRRQGHDRTIDILKPSHLVLEQAEVLGPANIISSGKREAPFGWGRDKSTVRRQILCPAWYHLSVNIVRIHPGLGGIAAEALRADRAFRCALGNAVIANAAGVGGRFSCLYGTEEAG